MIDPDGLSATRKRDALHHALGETVMAALADRRVVEILANPDGRLILDRLAEGRCDTGARLSAAARERVIRLVADHVAEPITRDDPRLAGALPTGERFQGFLPPIVAEPAFAIRKPSASVWSLTDYVDQAVMTLAQAAALRAAIAAKRSIVICGGAGSGKTSLANALLAEPAFAEERIFLIEDTPELQCVAWDLVRVLTRRSPRRVGVGDLVRDALRMRPDRIVVGEMRDGAAVLETLKAWNTGHPGGLSTLHANSAAEAIDRLEDLLAEVIGQAPHRLVARSVGLIVHIRRTAFGRRIDEVLTLDDLGDRISAGVSPGT